MTIEVRVALYGRYPYKYNFWRKLLGELRRINDRESQSRCDWDGDRARGGGTRGGGRVPPVLGGVFVFCMAGVYGADSLWAVAVQYLDRVLECLTYMYFFQFTLHVCYF